MIEAYCAKCGAVTENHDYLACKNNYYSAASYNLK